MHPFLETLDQYFIWFYRYPEDPFTGFLFGTFVLALHAVLIGEVTGFLAHRLIQQHLDQVTDESAKYQDLSIEALKAGDKTSYQAANKLANEAFGKSFFTLIALSGARLWPVPFALAWMQLRFLEVEFPIPGTGWSMGFIGAFIIIYVATYLAFTRLPSLRPAQENPGPG
jgi:hypothetical protein